MLVRALGAAGMMPCHACTGTSGPLRRPDLALSLLADSARLRRRSPNVTDAVPVERASDAATLRSSPRVRGGVREDTIEISNQPELDAAHAEIRAKDDALAMMAHDLRNPLAAITMSVAALRQHLASDVENSQLRESVRDHIELAESTVGAMTRMVADLLDGARIESIEAPCIALD